MVLGFVEDVFVFIERIVVVFFVNSYNVLFIFLDIEVCV